ncbi:MAG: hypothetical protein V4577_15805 [Bacteroidota bacterium]
MSNSMENALIVAVLFIIIAIPIYLSVRKAKRQKNKKIMDALYLLEKKHNISLQIMAQLDSFSIVFDKIKKLIVIVSLNDFRSEIIDFKEISNCSLEEKTQGKAVQLLQLVLSDKKGQPLHHIVFYKQYVDNEGSLKRTLLLAEEWQEMIKAVITDKKPVLILDKAN